MSASGYHLREDAVGGVGMDECDLETEETRTRDLVDELRAGGDELGERNRDILDLVGDMVHAGPAPGEETADRSVLPGRRQQLDARVADQHRGGLDSHVKDDRAVLELRREEAPVGLERLVQVRYGEAEVVDPAGAHRL